jgi:hypothetical protein
MGMDIQVVVVLPILVVAEMADRIEVVAENFVVVHIAAPVDSTGEQQVVRQVGSTVAQQVLQVQIP